MLRAPRAVVAAAVVAIASAPPAWGGLTLGQACDLDGPILVTAAKFELFTGPEVLNHLPGPGPDPETRIHDFGDFRIGTADDGIHPGLTSPPTSPFFPTVGCPNDLAGGSAAVNITCGVAGSPGTKLLHGTSVMNSQESALHGTDADMLSLSMPGHGAYSYLIAKVGRLQSLSYLTGGIAAVLTGFDATFAEVRVVNATLTGTTLVPNFFFQGPFNTDLMTVGPGDDLAWKDFRHDETAESIVRGCNGLARGVDGLDPKGELIDWLPQSPGPFPKFPDPERGNTGRWNLISSPDDGQGRLITSVADTLTKIPTAAGFFVTQDVLFNGYLFPLEEAAALLTPAFRSEIPPAERENLPDIPGFAGSGAGLARYFVDVLVPKADENPKNRLVAFLRGVATVEIIGVETVLDITIAGGVNFIDFDLCSLDVRPCTF